MTPEARIKKVIDQVLRNNGAYWHKSIGSPFGKPALDYDICRLGFYGVVEAKASPKKPPTPRQTEIMCQVLDAQGSVFLIDNSLGADMLELEAWLKMPRPHFVSSSALIWLISQEKKA